MTFCEDTLLQGGENRDKQPVQNKIGHVQEAVPRQNLNLDSALFKEENTRKSVLSSQQMDSC